MTKFLRLLCSNCSVAHWPEFRPFTMDKDTLTCESCGRTLKIKKDPSLKNHYYFEVTYEGEC